MRGLPIMRTSSPDGRWEYTLYDGAGAHPFVHALDTAARRAFCVDLDVLAHHEDPYRLSLALGADGNELLVRDRMRSLAVVDRTTFEVAAPWTAMASAAAGWLLPARAA
jgi:hypothetical protein